MMQKGRIESKPLTAKLKRQFCALFLMLVLVNVFSPVISLMAFYLGTERHLVTCLEHRHHADDCEAICILKELMPVALDAIPGKTISRSFLSTNLFADDHEMVGLSPGNGNLRQKLPLHSLLLYAPPYLGAKSPPPRLS